MDSVSQEQTIMGSYGQSMLLSCRWKKVASKSVFGWRYLEPPPGPPRTTEKYHQNLVELPHEPSKTYIHPRAKTAKSGLQ